MRTITFLFFACCTLFCSDTGFGQTVIWDQQPETSIPQVIDQEIPDQAIFSTYVVSDVTFGTAIMLSDVTVYFTNSNGLWENNISDARLCIFPGDYSSFDPSIDGQIVPVVVTDLGNNVLAITAQNLEIQLAAGIHWIGLSPMSPSSIPQEFHYASSNQIGGLSFARNPGGGFGLGTDWFSADTLSPSFLDAAITISDTGLFFPNIEPSSYSIIRGNLVAGTISDLIEDDDQRIEFRPGFVTSSDEAPIWLSFDGFLDDPNQFPVGFQIESQAGTPGLTLTVEEYNWDTSAYEILGEEFEEFNVDSTKFFGLNGYVSSSDGMRIRAGWRKTGFTINYPWEVRIDQVFWVPCT